MWSRFLPLRFLRERILLFFLRRLLNRFLERKLDAQQISVNCIGTSANVALHNLAINPKRINRMLAGEAGAAPIRVMSGSVGSAGLVVPLHITTEPSIVEIDGLSLVVRFNQRIDSSVAAARMAQSLSRPNPKTSADSEPLLRSLVIGDITRRDCKELLHPRSDDESDFATSLAGAADAPEQSDVDLLRSSLCEELTSTANHRTPESTKPQTSNNNNSSYDVDNDDDDFSDSSESDDASDSGSCDDSDSDHSAAAAAAAEAYDGDDGEDSELDVDEDSLVGYGFIASSIAKVLRNMRATVTNLQIDIQLPTAANECDPNRRQRRRRRRSKHAAEYTTLRVVIPKLEYCDVSHTNPTSTSAGTTLFGLPEELVKSFSIDRFALQLLCSLVSPITAATTSHSPPESRTAAAASNSAGTGRRNNGSDSDDDYESCSSGSDNDSDSEQSRDAAFRHRNVGSETAPANESAAAAPQSTNCNTFVDILRGDTATVVLSIAYAGRHSPQSSTRSSNQQHSSSGSLAGSGTLEAPRVSIDFRARSLEAVSSSPIIESLLSAFAALNVVFSGPAPAPEPIPPSLATSPQSHSAVVSSPLIHRCTVDVDRFEAVVAFDATNETNQNTEAKNIRSGVGNSALSAAAAAVVDLWNAIESDGRSGRNHLLVRALQSRIELTLSDDSATAGRQLLRAHFGSCALIERLYNKRRRNQIAAENRLFEITALNITSNMLSNETLIDVEDLSVRVPLSAIRRISEAVAVPLLRIVERFTAGKQPPTEQTSTLQPSPLADSLADSASETVRSDFCRIKIAAALLCLELSPATATSANKSACVSSVSVQIAELHVASFDGFRNVGVLVLDSIRLSTTTNPTVEVVLRASSAASALDAAASNKIVPITVLVSFDAASRLCGTGGCGGGSLLLSSSAATFGLANWLLYSDERLAARFSAAATTSLLSQSIREMHALCSAPYFAHYSLCSPADAKKIIQSNTAVELTVPSASIRLGTKAQYDAFIAAVSRSAEEIASVAAAADSEAAAAALLTPISSIIDSLMDPTTTDQPKAANATPAAAADFALSLLLQQFDVSFVHETAADTPTTSTAQSVNTPPQTQTQTDSVLLFSDTGTEADPKGKGKASPSIHQQTTTSPQSSPIASSSKSSSTAASAARDGGGRTAHRYRVHCDDLYVAFIASQPPLPLTAIHHSDTHPLHHSRGTDGESASTSSASDARRQPTAAAATVHTVNTYREIVTHTKSVSIVRLSLESAESAHNDDDSDNDAAGMVLSSYEDLYPHHSRQQLSQRLRRHAAVSEDRSPDLFSDSPDSFAATPAVPLPANQQYEYESGQRAAEVRLALYQQHRYSIDRAAFDPHAAASSSAIGRATIQHRTDEKQFVHVDLRRVMLTLSKSAAAAAVSSLYSDHFIGHIIDFLNTEPSAAAAAASNENTSVPLSPIEDDERVRELLRHSGSGVERYVHESSLMRTVTVHAGESALEYIPLFVAPQAVVFVNALSLNVISTDSNTTVIRQHPMEAAAAVDGGSPRTVYRMTRDVFTHDSVLAVTGSVEDSSLLIHNDLFAQQFDERALSDRSQLQYRCVRLPHRSRDSTTESIRETDDSAAASSSSAPETTAPLAVLGPALCHELKLLGFRQVVPKFDATIVVENDKIDIPVLFLSLETCRDSFKALTDIIQSLNAQPPPQPQPTDGPFDGSGAEVHFGGDDTNAEMFRKDLSSALNSDIRCTTTPYATPGYGTATSSSDLATERNTTATSSSSPPTAPKTPSPQSSSIGRQTTILHSSIVLEDYFSGRQRSNSQSGKPAEKSKASQARNTKRKVRTTDVTPKLQLNVNANHFGAQTSQSRTHTRAAASTSASMAAVRISVELEKQTAHSSYQLIDTIHPLDHSGRRKRLPDPNAPVQIIEEFIGAAETADKSPPLPPNQPPTLQPPIVSIETPRPSASQSEVTTAQPKPDMGSSGRQRRASRSQAVLGRPPLSGLNAVVQNYFDHECRPSMQLMLAKTTIAWKFLDGLDWDPNRSRHRRSASAAGSTPNSRPTRGTRCVEVTARNVAVQYAAYPDSHHTATTLNVTAQIVADFKSKNTTQRLLSCDGISFKLMQHNTTAASTPPTQRTKQSQPQLLSVVMDIKPVYIRLGQTADPVGLLRSFFMTDQAASTEPGSHANTHTNGSSSDVDTEESLFFRRFDVTQEITLHVDRINIMRDIIPLLDKSTAAAAKESFQQQQQQQQQQIPAASGSSTTPEAAPSDEVSLWENVQLEDIVLAFQPVFFANIGWSTLKERLAASWSSNVVNTGVITHFVGVAIKGLGKGAAKTVSQAVFGKRTQTPTTHSQTSEH